MIGIVAVVQATVKSLVDKAMLTRKELSNPIAGDATKIINFSTCMD